MNKDTSQILQRNIQNSSELRDWKHIFEQKINCNKNDVKCWKTLLPSLPCNLKDTKCWKNKYPEMPCSSTDQECWKKLLPELPCRLQDEQCWRKYNLSSFERFSPKFTRTVETIGETMAKDTDAIWLL